MTIKLAWDNTNPIVANKGGVKSYLGSMVACEEKLRTLQMYPIMMTGALNIQDTPRKAELREEKGHEATSNTIYRRNQLSPNPLGKDN